MRAAILVEQNRELIVDDVEIPEELHLGQVLVKVSVSGICGSQIGEIKGVKGQDRFLPHLMGHEGCGEIIKTGPGVKNLSIGDRVCLHWRQGIGLQSEPPIYKWKGKNLNAGWVTTFNNFAIVSENRCTKVPEFVSDDNVALFGCAVTTGFGVVENNANLKMGESILIYGAGGVGLNIVQASKLKSAWPIIAVDLVESRLQLAKKLGATHLINGSNTNVEEEVRKIIGTDGLDVFIDNTGIPKIIKKGFELTKSVGRIILVGVPKKGNELSIYTLPLHFGKVITGSHGGESIPHKDIPRYINLIKRGIWSLDEFVSARYSLDDINCAIDDMQKGKTAGRIMIDMPH